MLPQFIGWMIHETIVFNAKTIGQNILSCTCSRYAHEQPARPFKPSQVVCLVFRKHLTIEKLVVWHNDNTCNPFNFTGNVFAFANNRLIYNSVVVLKSRQLAIASWELHALEFSATIQLPTSCKAILKQTAKLLPTVDYSMAISWWPNDIARNQARGQQLNQWPILAGSNTNQFH